jgi:polyisoprenoid-binding protein YceI
MTDHGSALSGDWDFDPAHTRIGFSARHAMVTTVRGSFNDVTGRLYADVEDMSKSYAEVTLKAASVDTRNQQRDDHLRSADFFDVANHPSLTFRSTGVSGGGSDWKLDGELTIAGVTKPVTLDVEFEGVVVDPWGNTKAGFVASTTVNREDFGLTWNAALETGGFLVGKTVTIDLEVELGKQ